MTIKLKEKERIDELHRNGYQIIQNMVFVLAWMLCFCPAILWSKKESVCWIWALALELFPFFWRQRQKGNILLG
jgi:hypothetical protein